MDVAERINNQVKKSTEVSEVIRRDYTALTGIGIAVAAVAGGCALQRGNMLDLFSLHALVIVLGGTAGAVLIGTPRGSLASALQRCRSAFKRKSDKPRDMADLIIRYAALVRRGGAPSIEADVEAMEHGFLRRALLLIVDQISPQEVHRQLESEIAAEEDHAEASARVLEQAGGYAPTIGIMGAVLGLIQVMKHLGNADAVGRGIAAAFVSTLYGVALANLLLLPLAARLRVRAQMESRNREMILHGVTAIAEGLSLHVVRSRLETFAAGNEAAPANRNFATMPGGFRRTA